MTQINSKDTITYQAVCPFNHSLVVNEFTVPASRKYIAPQPCTAHGDLPKPEPGVTIDEYIEQVNSSGFNRTLFAHDTVIIHKTK